MKERLSKETIRLVFVSDFKFLVNTIKYYDRHLEYGTRFLGFRRFITIAPNLYKRENQFNMTDSFQNSID